MGAVFLHGAAVTIHKAQGSQWDEVQVFAPDLYAAAQVGPGRGGAAALEAARLRRDHAGRAAAALGDALPRSRRPKAPLGIEDLARERRAAGAGGGGE